MMCFLCKYNIVTNIMPPRGPPICSTMILDTFKARICPKISIILFAPNSPYSIAPVDLLKVTKTSISTNPRRLIITTTPHTPPSICRRGRVCSTITVSLFEMSAIPVRAIRNDIKHLRILRIQHGVDGDVEEPRLEEIVYLCEDHVSFILLEINESGNDCGTTTGLE